MSSDVVIVIVVGAAIVYGFVNGFQDVATTVTSAISTGAASPGVAVAAAALLNFAGAFLSLSVAATVAREIVDPEVVTPTTVLAGLAGAIAWVVLTARLELPSSSSHALLGGVVGATLVAFGADGILGAGLVDKVLLPALAAPLVAFLAAGAAIALIYRLVARRRPSPVRRAFQAGQALSGGLLAVAHGANDAQKAMGVIALALIAEGSLGGGADPPFWAIASAASAIGLGTYTGGWRMLRGGRAQVLEMDAAQAFSAQAAGAGTILAATQLGFPISTTHAINGGVMGAGAAKRLSAVRWGVAGHILAAWLLTLPAAAAIGAAAYGLLRLLGVGP